MLHQFKAKDVFNVVTNSVFNQLSLHTISCRDSMPVG